MKHTLLALGLTLLSTPVLAEQPSMEKCWSDTLYRQYDCPAVGWPYGTITQEQAERGGPIFIGKDWPSALPAGVSKMTDTHGWHKPHAAPKDRPFLAWCPDATIPFTVVKWSNEFRNFTRIDTRGLRADFAFWMELPEGPQDRK